ncbi:MAG: hypothetical protein JHC93_05810 [Parachlamydiales bacterium]|nr:hypothetical protein [Parachlamydiales bacterium]
MSTIPEFYSEVPFIQEFVITPEKVEESIIEQLDSLETRAKELPPCQRSLLTNKVNQMRSQVYIDIVQLGSEHSSAEELIRYKYKSYDKIIELQNDFFVNNACYKDSCSGLSNQFDDLDRKIENSSITSPSFSLTPKELLHDNVGALAGGYLGYKAGEKLGVRVLKEDVKSANAQFKLAKTTKDAAAAAVDIAIDSITQNSIKLSKISSTAQDIYPQSSIKKHAEMFAEHSYERIRESSVNHEVSCVFEKQALEKLNFIKAQAKAASPSKLLKVLGTAAGVSVGAVADLILNTPKHIKLLLD